MNKPAMLIALPTNLTMGGVQVWAARLVNALVQRGRAAGLLLHPPVGTPLDLPLDPRVKVTDVAVARPLTEADGDLSPYLPFYARAVDELYEATGRPVVCVPCHVGDCAGLFAELTRTRPGKVRVAGWCHLDVPYDVRVLEWYRPVMGHVAAVSEHLAGILTKRLAGVKVWSIANGVEPAAGARPARRGGALRVLYLGRLNKDVKRVMALVPMCDELARLGVAHTLTVVGDGPAAEELDAAVKGRANVTRIVVAGPARVTELMDAHDVFVLPSRVEGLSLAMLEAMARGCVPVVARTESGCGQVIDGSNGLIVDVATTAGEAEVGAAMARGVKDAAGRLEAMARSAMRTIEERFSLAGNVDVVERLLDEAGAEEARVWPAGRPAAFTAPDPVHGSGAVPRGGAERLRVVLEGLRGRRVILHGAGRHSVELAGVLAEFQGCVVAFTDDDPVRRGQELLGLPILGPGEAGRTGATDVVISSWMNQELIWDGRRVYEAQGMAVHRLYAAKAA